MLTSSCRHVIAGLITLSLSVLPPPASALFGAGDIVYDPTNYAQNVLTAARALQSNLNEAAQIANQLKQIEMEVRNLVNWPTEVWNEVKADMEMLRQLANSSGDISTALSTLSAQFNRLYPGYQAPADYQQEYQTWTSNSLTGIKTALETVNRQNKAIEEEEANTQRLTNMSASAVGQLQVLQSGNLLAAQLVQQLQNLRELQMAEMQAQNAYMAAQIQDQASEKAAIKKWLDSDIGYKSKM
ncbi:MAG TPA: P-type conjugative transfer protein TrbJ [Candidatus Competibacteraceae bacterium]|nr:P-type conjugative transfer protein TrbJ [Candidatus Competibacteraceae bacterium]